MERKSFLPFFATSLLWTSFASADSITLSTYYPAPMGVYQRIRISPSSVALNEPCQVGTLYVDEGGKLHYCAQAEGEPSLKEDQGQWRDVISEFHSERGEVYPEKNGDYPVKFEKPFSDVPIIQVYTSSLDDKKKIPSVYVYIKDITLEGFNMAYNGPQKDILIVWVAMGD